MKRALFILVLSSSALFAQVRGVPASVTSYNGNRNMAPGVPASVTSLGPNGYSPGVCLGVLGCTNPNFQTHVNFQTGTVTVGNQIHTGTRPGTRGHRGHNRNGGYVGGYSYAYPVYIPVQPETNAEGSAEEQQPEPPAPTVFERRPEVRPAPNPTPSEEERPLASTHHNMSPVDEETTPVVIVFKDGHEQEIGNYAIVGDTLYDLSGKLAHKVKLAELDLNSTIRRNEDRGVEFNVPLSQRPQG